MASSLTIETGPLTSTLSWANDAKVQDTLLHYYEIMGLGEDTATNQEKLDAVVANLANHVQLIVKRYERSARESTLEAGIDADYGLE